MTIECAYCRATQDEQGALLGRLGKLVHYRCRYCGGDWHDDAVDRDNDIDDASIKMERRFDNDDEQDC